MNIKIEGWKVTIHNENGDRLELNGEFEADFFKEYESKQLIIADVVGQSEQLPEYYLDYCERCMQMTNHLNGICQKCK